MDMYPVRNFTNRKDLFEVQVFSVRSNPVGRKKKVRAKFRLSIILLIKIHI